MTFNAWQNPGIDSLFLYEGKAKILYPGSEVGTIRQYFKDDATAFNAQKRDVISGKGGSKTQHNAFFVSICRKFASEYEATNKRGMAGKRGLAVKIVKAVQANKGRFLKPSQNGSEWEELSDKDAVRKVAHCMRDLVYKRKKQAKRLERKFATMS